MEIGHGTRAIVTGAGRGIGRALARELAERGATVGLAARSRRELESLARALPGEHVVLECDVSDPHSVERAFAEFGGGGRIDLVVANAGIAHYGPFRDVPLDKLAAMTQINWMGTVHTCKAALPRLTSQGRGHVVIVSSGAALRSFPQAAVYGATKAAQRAFGEALWHELDGTGVGLTIVYPGEIRSALHDHEKDHLPSWYQGGERAAPAEAMAAAIVKAVERDARACYYPRVVRLLRLANGISPRLADAILRRLRHRSVAPRT